MTEALLARLAEVAAKEAHRTAVEGPSGDGLSYVALWERVGARADVLRRAGLERGHRVVLSRSRSIELVVDLLACFRLEVAPVLVDPAGPSARRAQVTRLSRPMRVLEDDGDRAGARDPAVDLGVAYVVFTSGSSGTPKGVRLPSAGLVPLLDAQIEAFALRPGARSLAFLSPGFDAFLSDVGCALLSGATLVMPSDAERASVDATVRAVGRRRITHLDYPPALLAQIEPDAWPTSLEVLVVGGEASRPERLAAHAARRTVVNVYGPSECTICTSLGVVDARTWTQPRIGEPLPHVRYRVGDGEELWIGGSGLAVGYLDLPTEDRRAFVEAEGERWYRTGDRVRAAPGPGGYEFVGRLDRQLKLGGVRVELGEIEQRILAISGALGCVVEPRDEGGLVAYVEGGTWTEAALRARLDAELPGVAIPRAFVRLMGALPRSLNGKVARERLPRGPLAELLELILGATPDPALSFRDNGGDSLAAMQIAALGGTLGVDIDPSALDAAPSLDAALRGEAAPVRFHRADELVLEAPTAIVRGAARASGAGAPLVFGAAGFLGARTLCALASRGDGPVVAFVRATDADAARARIERALGGERLPARVRVICRTEELTDVDLSHVFACAGAVSLVGTGPRVTEANLGPARVAAALAARADARLVLASSLAPFVARVEPAGDVLEDAVLPDDARVAGAYAAAKWAVERGVRARDPAAVVVRFGLLVGARDTGRSHARCQLGLFARGLAAAGAAPALGAGPRLDLTPIDVAAEAFVALGLAAPAGAYHVASERGVEYESLVGAIARRCPIETCDWTAFEQRARLRAREPGVGVALLGLRRRAARDESALAVAADLLLTTGARFDRARSSAIVGAARLPTPSEALLDRLVAAALGREAS